MFTSDNGPWLSYGNHAGSPGPFREGKGTTFEGGVRVPCLARWPGQIPKGQVAQLPAMNIDMLPTLAVLAGATVPPGRPIDGRDIWPSHVWRARVKTPHEAYTITGMTGCKRSVAAPGSCTCRTPIVARGRRQRRRPRQAFGKDRAVTLRPRQGSRRNEKCRRREPESSIYCGLRRTCPCGPWRLVDQAYRQERPAGGPNVKGSFFR